MKPTDEEIQRRDWERKIYEEADKEDRRKMNSPMTPSEEKTAEERAVAEADRIRQEIYAAHASAMEYESDARYVWPKRFEAAMAHVGLLLIEANKLRLTNQRLEAEVERMKEVLKSIEGQIVGGYLSGRGEQSALWRIRELSSRAEQKGKER